MKIILRVGTVALRILYCFYKLFPTKNRIMFVSRQDDVPSPDCYLLSKAIREEDQKIEIIQEFRRIPDSFIGKIKYIGYMLGRQMYLFATSKVVILDGYCILASVLNHKKELKIVQMWHAMGALKKFGFAAIGTEEGKDPVILDGYCILASVLNHKKELKIVQMWHAMGALKKFGFAAIGTEEGKDPEVSKILCMHRNYDYVICSCKECAGHYEEAFGVPQNKIITMTLPRVDLLTDLRLKELVQARVYHAFPDLKKKKNILYVPTFRMHEEMGEKIKELIESVDFTRYNLIVKLHPLTKEKVDMNKCLECEGFTALELLNVADYVISDYSAFIFEVAAAEKPLFLYTYDLGAYMEQRGFFIDYNEEMPVPRYRDAETMIKALECNDCDMERIRNFANKYVENRYGCSQKLAEFICALYNENIKE